MSAAAATSAPIPPRVTNALDAKITRTPGKIGAIVFGVVLLIGAIYAGSHLLSDLQRSEAVSSLAYVLLGIALLIALGFEFVNGFHDTANAVATVIYTHTLEPHVAVVWSGIWNFLGVLTSTGAVAFGIVSLLPVELILKVGTGAGFSMIFALLVAAIIWNLLTWYFGIPNSSSHTLIGSIMGVGLMNQFLANGGTSGTSGVDWSQALQVGKSLLFSPIIGFICSALLLVLMKTFIKKKELYQEPKGTEPPPFWIRGLLFLTCTGVSFAHGSNDGQKGMGLIMLILIGTVPTAYALNHAVKHDQVQTFIAVSEKTENVLKSHEQAGQSLGLDQQKAALEKAINAKNVDGVALSYLGNLVNSIKGQVSQYDSLSDIPSPANRNVRNDMYLASETIRVMEKTKQPALGGSDDAAIANYKRQLDKATKFIPDWVKVAVALALGLGTMVGWKRIVVTVGEKIGKNHLTYAQGASAELVAMCTILAADRFGLPVSTTHVLTSGVAGTMAANGSGLQMATIRSLVAAWVLTLPASIALAAGLYWLFRHMFGG
ncbi:MAG: inorganic phosphate transporter [Acidobacteriaceae bacterium]|nr:inorganic phosphate transporter [Acidobacteriaceae bacterium]